MKKKPGGSKPVYHKIPAGHPSARILRETVSLLKKGGLIVFPTDTFYGLGADPENASAVERLYRIKGRKFEKAVSVVVADRAAIGPLAAEVPPVAERLMDRYWPGPLTLLFPVRPRRDTLPVGETGRIGVRIPDHPVARSVLSAWGRPLTATSANPSGGAAPAAVSEIDRKVLDAVDLVLDAGATKGGAASTILDVTFDPPRLVREGGIPYSEIMEALGYGLTEPHDW